MIFIETTLSKQLASNAYHCIMLHCKSGKKLEKRWKKMAKISKKCEKLGKSWKKIGKGGKKHDSIENHIGQEDPSVFNYT